MWLLLIFIAIPLIEIGLFIQLGGFLGLWPTLAIVLVTAIIGSWLVRAQGLQAMANIRNSMSGLADPSEALANGAMILLAGVLLLTPGFFTDGVGFLLMFPPFRLAAFRFARSKMNVVHFSVGGVEQPYGQSQGNVIDGEFEEIDAKNDRTPPPNH